jgi:endonuclease/exonuclease/phosphatase (EEP) superfamily protein YafD
VIDAQWTMDTSMQRGIAGGCTCARAARALLAALLACSSLSCATPPPFETRSREPVRLTIATYNVHFPAWEDASTVETIGATGADVVFLQEVSPQWQAVLEARYREWYPHQLFAAAPAAGGLGVLSRLPLRDEGFLPAVYRHPAWLVAVQTPLGELSVLNVHLRASRRTAQNLLSGLWTQSDDHEEEIRRFVLACGVWPALVLGDFNEGPRGSAIRWLAQHGYVDTLERHDPGAATFSALAGLYRATLDHILAQGHLHAIDARVLYAGNSDHFPVVARF